MPPRPLVSLAALVCAGCAPREPTYADYGDRAVAALERVLYTGAGTWRRCVGSCGAGNRDWGDDSLTYTLYLRWSIAHEPSIGPIFAALSATAAVYAPCAGAACDAWSDMPEWDAIADEREFEVTGDPVALDRAKRAYASVRDSDAYSRGACPTVRYQQPLGGGGGLKTLETESNAIKAALLLWRATREPSYLSDAEAAYAAARAYFLDATWPLYTVYLFDDGTSCTQLPRRFFASVNGNMIWSGVALANETGNARYLDDATRTATAVDQSLSDGRGVFVDLQAENDVVEPLVEAFYVLAAERRWDPARAWILKNARAAISGARTPDDLYGRFFDAPAPAAPVTSWQTNGGAALAVAAAALAPADLLTADAPPAGRSITRDVAALPSSIEFTGSGVVLFGTLGERCCEPGHAAVMMDGQDMVDQTGIWQNKSSAGVLFEDATLFAWRWASAGAHTLTFVPPAANTKEGGPF
ncbi:MAG TPA: hypothetical protein VE987_07195, partial [Polyangiaceae bacterium]|nr:hypothetical protein [Polyangiaceae bacterium]